MKKSVRSWLFVSLLVGGFISLLASSQPDGFEKAGEQAGYIEHASNYLTSPLPNYALPGSDAWYSSSFAGLLGVLITFGCCILLGKWIAGRNR